MEEFQKLSFKALGTIIELQLSVTHESAQRAAQDLKKARELYEQFELALSRFDSESELSKVNAAAEYCVASTDLLEIAKRSLQYYEQTEHTFDPRIKSVIEAIGYAKDFHSLKDSVKIKTIATNFSNRPLGEDLVIRENAVCFKKQMDFSGIGKGYITDKVAVFFKNQGYTHFVVDSGGDMYCASGDSSWNIDIEGVHAAQLTFHLQNKAIATSGISRRKWEHEGKRAHHLINPFTPDQFRFDIKSVTCIMDSAEQADVWAKVLFLMGPEKGLQFAEHNHIACIFVGYQGTVRISHEAKKYLA